MALLEASSLDLPALFPGLSGRTFLNTATMGQLPATANQALIGHLQHREQSAATDAPLWFDSLDRLRAKLASLIHASPTDIAFIPSTAHGLAIPLHGLDWQPGDEILTLDPEFPNNTYAPAQLARRGVVFREVPLSSLPSSVSPRTRLIIVSALNYATGLRAPLSLIRSLAPHALRYVDGTQGRAGNDAGDVPTSARSGRRYKPRPMSISLADEALVALEAHDASALVELLEREPGLAKARLDDGDTLLHWACHHKFLAAVELLLSARADVYASGPRWDYGEFFLREVDRGALTLSGRRGDHDEVMVLTSERR